ncbi:hypothetical protein PoB_000722000 [Plakobranchus ocellatus]|uniref:Uncharacterized protein n=1 Tax=Plakobranchus ocellatus TaxID=259542 RepID=A0AAV3YDE3_9GAST|nr:hypothetical protein PoB_000722000 [Plakobranchus ocellatus]
MEKTELACNGPCGRMSLTCPSGHTVAVRDAVYRVQEKTDTCTSFSGCSDSEEDVCCDPTAQDCIFAFSPSHLRAVQKNCSHAPGCELQTERSEVESVQCSASDPASHTLVNYVCINVSSAMIACCVEAEWITMSGLITSGCLYHSERSAETSKSSQPSSRPFLWVFIVIDPPCHFFTPPYVVNTVELVEEGWISPSAVLMTEASS